MMDNCENPTKRDALYERGDLNGQWVTKDMYDEFGPDVMARLCF